MLVNAPALNSEPGGREDSDAREPVCVTSQAILAHATAGEPHSALPVVQWLLPSEGRCLA